MPTEKEFEGKTWVLKSDVDEIVSSRLSDVTRKKSEAETRASSAERELEGLKKKVGEADAMASQLADLRAELASANARYDRHSAIAAAGITDPDLRDAVEWAWERSQAKLPKKDQKSLEDTLAAWKEDPESSPASVRHMFVAQDDDDAATDAGVELEEEEEAPEPPARGAKPGAGAGKGAPAAGGKPDPKAPAQPKGKPLPKLPKQAGNKPTPGPKGLTLERIYGASDDELDSLMAEYKGGA